MPSFKIAALAALVAVAPAVMAGTASIKNNCDFPVFVTHSANGADGEQMEYKSGESYSKPIEGDAVCLKIMTKRGFCFTDSCMQLEYTSQPQMLWYDLSMINGESLKPFMPYGMTVNVSDPNAQQIDCPIGADKCQNTYYTPDQNENSLSAKPDADLTMNLCSSKMNSGSAPKPLSSVASAASSMMGGVSSAVSSAVQPAAPSSNVHHDTQSSEAPKAPAAPSTTSAPKVPEVPSYGGPVVEVTVTHTVSGAPSQATNEKRHMHAHAHHHRH